MAKKTPGKGSSDRSPKSKAGSAAKGSSRSDAQPTQAAATPRRAKPAGGSGSQAGSASAARATQVSASTQPTPRAAAATQSNGTTGSRLAAHPSPAPATPARLHERQPTPERKVVMASEANKNSDKHAQDASSNSNGDGSPFAPDFLEAQRGHLLELRDMLLDQMQDVAQGNLRAESEGVGGVGQHMGDAGSDAYEKSFALSLLSQEQDALYEIEEAIKRLEAGTYGVCEKSNKVIPIARLEAIPWARFTVECQAELERSIRGRNRWESVPQFMDVNEGEDDDDEEGEADDELRQRVRE